MKRYYSLLIVFSFFPLLFPRLVDASTLQFAETRKDISVGEETSVSIELNPQGNSILGVDIVVLYDPNVLSVIDVQDQKLFSQKTAQIIDSEKGILKVAFANEYGKYVTKKGTVGEIIILGKSEAKETFLSFHFVKDETIDSNVTGYRGIDYLTSVNTLALTINTSLPTNPSTTPDPTVTTNATLTPTRGQGKNRISTPTKTANNQSVLGAEDEGLSDDSLSTESIMNDQIPAIQKETTKFPFLIAIVVVLLVSFGGLFYFVKRNNGIK